MKVSKLALMCLVMLAVLAGCKSSRKATGDGGAEAKEGRALLKAVEEGALEFHTLSARLSADLKLQDGKELGSRVELKMVRDSMIQLSVQPFLGIEVFRLELTTDTVRLIDRMGKRYVAERYSGLLEQSPVDFNFYNLQALFINRVFLPGQADFTKKEYNRFRMSRAPEYTEFKATDRGKLFYTFRIDRETAQQNFSKWVKSRWFAPNRLKQAYQAGKLQGMYLPFWTFDAEVTSRYWGSGGTQHHVRDRDGKTRTEVRWRPVSGQVGGSYDDLQVCAAQNSASQVVEKVLPYNTVENTTPFSPSYLSGFLAERYAIPATQAVDSAQAQIQADQESRAEGEILSRGYSLARVDRVEVCYHRLTYKHVLLPAWTSAFSYKGKRYMYIINGESGKVGGQRPYSVPKILAAVGVAAAAFAAAVLLLSGEPAPRPVETL